MEPSPSLDATIVLRTAQGESHFGARVVIDPASGAMRADLDRCAPPERRAAAGLAARGLGPLAVRCRAGRPHQHQRRAGGRRAHRHRRRRHQRRGLAAAGRGGPAALAGPAALRAGRHRHAAARGRQRAHACSRRPKICRSTSAKCRASRARCRRARARAPRSKLNYAAWAMGLLLLVVLGTVRAAQAHRARPAARPTPTCARSAVSRGSRPSSVFVFPGDHTLRAERTGYEPAEVQA